MPEAAQAHKAITGHDHEPEARAGAVLEKQTGARAGRAPYG